MIKINLGSGPQKVRVWINFDYGLLPLLGKLGLTKLAWKLGLIDKSYVVKWPKIRYFDIRRRLPFGNDSVDFIYCSHVLEHFEKFETLSILRECLRILKNGGVIRIVLPDIQKIISGYEGADKFCREFYGYGKDTKRWTNIFIRGHQWMYDKESFKELLGEAGFKTIKVKSIGKGQTPNLDKLDLKVHEKLSFYYECQKN